MHPVRFTDPGRRRSSLTLADDTNPLLPLIHKTRQQLLDHQAYREPFLKCLLSLYRTGSATHRRERRKIRPTDPTDADIHTFILSHWPEVQLRERRDFMPRFEHDVGEVRPLDSAIHVNRALATQLIKKVNHCGIQHHSI